GFCKAFFRYLHHTNHLKLKIMKRNYFLTMLLLLSGMLASAQLIANDDIVPMVNSSTAQFGVYNVLNNDSLNGAPVSSAVVSLTQLTSDHPSIEINQVGWVTVYPGVPAGSYTLTYQICQISNPGNCATA